MSAVNDVVILCGGRGTRLQEHTMGSGAAIAPAGKGAAVREGMLRARGQHRAFSDADLSTPLEELARLRARLVSNCHVAIASRGLLDARSMSTSRGGASSWAARTTGCFSCWCSRASATLSVG